MAQTFLHLDPATINGNVKAEIRSNHADLVDIGCDIGIVRFKPIVFCHAVMLLGQFPHRFGYDLSMYLSTVNVFFERTTQDGFIVIGDGSADFKKRMAEDLGVGLASLFMVRGLRLKWKTIAQIPTNGKLSRYRPDFLGFTENDQRYIYEAKGTTQANKLEEAMVKALKQSKSYSDQALAKFAIASYFPSSGKQLPPFTFVADPPIAALFPPERRLAIMLHYVNVLEYCGFQRTRIAYEALLVEVFAFERKGESLARLSYRPYPIKEKVNEVSKSYESEGPATFAWRERVFVGRYLTAKQGDRVASVFLGVDKEHIERILRLEVETPESEDIAFEGTDESISIFSDGTIIRVGPS